MTRCDQINVILSKLHKLLSKESDPRSRKTIEENIIFFRNITTPFKYIKWLFTKAFFIDKSNIKEINELLPEYDENVYNGLTQVEKKNFPGILRPLVEKIYQYCSKTEKLVLLVSLGCGAMELERQLVLKLLKDSSKSRFIFIGVDISEVAFVKARDNLSEISNVIEFFDITTVVELEKKINTIQKQFGVCFYKSSVLELNGFKPDISYTTLFLHHLSDFDRLLLIKKMSSLSKSVMYYDGYRNLRTIIPQTIEAWNNPVFLNATIFSLLRYMTKREIKFTYKNFDKLKFYKIGTYLALQNQNQR